MARREVAAVILAAGQGTRMKSERPKVAFDVCGWPMVRHVVEAARGARAKRVVVVVGHGREQIEKALAGVPGVEFAVQREQKGTAEAVKAGLRPLRDFDGTVLVLCGDVPLVGAKTLRDLLTAHNRRKAAASVLSVTLADGAAYGRVLRDESGAFTSIREARDCSAEELAVREINSGLYAFDADALRSSLRAVRANNAQSEYYLTDVPAILLKRGQRVMAIDCGTEDEVLGTVHVKDQLQIPADRRASTTVDAVAAQPLFVPESETLRALLDELRLRRRTFAVVVDEYGSTAGIVTLEDVLETLVGDIEDEFDRSGTGTVARGPRASERVSGAMTLARFTERFGIELPEGPYETIAGLVMAEAGRVPEVGDRAQHGGLELVVSRREGLRVTELTVRRMESGS